MAATVLSALILLLGVALLAVSLRTASQSILRQQFAEDYSSEIAETMQLEFLTIRNTLEEAPEDISDYGGLVRTLERDFLALTYLLRNAATVHIGRYTGRERLLVLDFQLLRLWVRVNRILGLAGWRSSLLEMTQVLEYFSNVIGHRLATFPLPSPR